MLVHELSDVHLEHYQDPDKAIKFLEYIRPVEYGDVLILAGDIASLSSHTILRYFDEFQKWAMEVVYVPGNHEFYGTDPEALETKAVLKSIQNQGVRVLGPHAHPYFRVNGVKFVGATGWYPVNTTTKRQVEAWNDKVFIKNFKDWWPVVSKEESASLWKEAEEGCVMVTHMLPAWECVDLKFQGSLDNCLYVNTESIEMIKEVKPGYWFFGHTHVPFNSFVMETHCLCNSIGYPQHIKIEDVKVLSIEIPDKERSI